MKKIFKIIASYWQFFLTLAIGIVALILAFVAKQEDLARLMVGVYGIFISVFLSIDMVKTLKDGNYGVDVLAITAIIATLAVGQFWASLLIMVMLTGGETLEDFAAHRARRELSELINRAPQTAHLLYANKISEVPISKVKPGDILVVKSHEVVPVDAILLSKNAEFDESSLTGEALPVAKKTGEDIMSGSVNGNSAIEIQASQTAKNSQFEQIIKLVQEAESKPAPFVRLADRYSIPFTIIAYLIAGTAWLISGSAERFAEVLVVASPCPLILAAPIAMISGMSRASRHGIIVKSGAVLEKVASADTFAFDKTGTLTYGEVAVSGVEPSGDFSKSQLLTIAASAESGSSHILAESLTAYAKEHRVHSLPAKNIREMTGDGIFATVDNHKVLIGKMAFLKKNKIRNLPTSNQSVLTVSYVAVDGKYAGAIYFSDIVREDTHQTISALKELGVKTIAMLTGDKKPIAEKVASVAGVDIVLAELLPAEKVKAIRDMSKRGNSVVMVGDGVNDAPVLAAADVGIAMGARGSTAASESADAVIMLDKISLVSLLKDISKHTIHIALQSILVGIILCSVLMVVAAFGKIPALVGAGLQELIDVTVIFNALRAHRDENS